MTLEGVFRARERALENEFFRRVDQRLVEQLQQQMADEETRKSLEISTNISDPNVLDELVNLGFKPETITVMSLVPLILVAWADAHVDEKERASILAAAHEQGIEDGSPALGLLESWLHDEPTSALKESWRHYTQALSTSLGDAASGALRDGILRRAREVAKASGGTLGLGKISAEEKRVLDELASAFDRQ